jgi:ABC-2 type transport system ATP-binding protein
LFTINEEKKDEKGSHLTIQINPGFSSNDVLNFLIPKVQVTELTEIVPSMNDIFIQNVKN